MAEERAREARNEQCKELQPRANSQEEAGQARQAEGAEMLLNASLRQAWAQNCWQAEGPERAAGHA